MKRKGISLIVLVITIVVIIILAAAVILSLGKNNPIESAKEAKVKTTIDNLKSELVMSVSKITADTLGQVAITDIDAPGKYTVTELIPSIKDTEYENELVVVDGKIQIKENSTLSSEAQLSINSIINTEITADLIRANPRAYIGQYVEYTGYSEENNQDIKWRIFNVNGDVIQLISDDYVDLSNKTLTGLVKVFDKYNIYIAHNTGDVNTNRDVLIEYLLNKESWNEYAVSGLTTAVGAATVQEFINSYNMVNVDDIEISDSVENARALGYMSKFKSGGEFLYQLPGLIDFNSLYILPKKGDTIDYRLASKSANYITAMLSVSSTSHLSCPGFESQKCGVRPIVSLESGAKLVQNNGVIKVVEK